MGIFVLINVTFTIFCDIFKIHSKTGQNMSGVVPSSFQQTMDDARSMTHIDERRLIAIAHLSD